jgi:hypothetical protein
MKMTETASGDNKMRLQKQGHDVEKKVKKNMVEEKPYKIWPRTGCSLSAPKNIRTCGSTPVSLQENFVRAATGATIRGLRSFACIPSLLPWRI